MWEGFSMKARCVALWLISRLQRARVLTSSRLQWTYTVAENLLFKILLRIILDCDFFWRLWMMITQGKHGDMLCFSIELQHYGSMK